jgi:hypothetical protein
MHRTKYAYIDRMRGIAAVFLAITLAMRIVASPAVMASPAPGIMAICSGGKIVYVSMKTGLPVDESEGPASVPCPYFNVTTVLSVDDAPFVAPVPVVVDRVVASAPYTRPGLRPIFDARPRDPPAITES